MLIKCRTLYEFIASRSEQPPLLIDSADLLERPNEVMEAYCKHTGVEFDPGMLKWDACEQEHFKKWTGFHT